MWNQKVCVTFCNLWLEMAQIFPYEAKYGPSDIRDECYHTDFLF